MYLRMAGDIYSLRKKLEELQAEIRRQAALTDSIVSKLHEGRHAGPARRTQEEAEAERDDLED